MLRLTSALLSMALAALAQQTTPNQAQASSQDPARLEGKVISAAGGQPLKKVNLTLRPLGSKAGEAQKPYGTVTDAEGKFVFEVVEPGRYSLSAERTGYVRQSYGSKHALPGGATITLTAGQALKDIVMQLTPEAVLSGKVTDEDGDPVGRVQVRALQTVYRIGKRTTMTRHYATTGEDGDFKITSLEPGRYFLCAGTPMRMMSQEATRSASADPSKTNAPREDYAPTCYPNASDAASAAPIDVAAGRDVPGLEIRLKKSIVVRVTGQLTGAIPGKTYDQMQVTLQSVDGGFMSSGNVDKKGSFELPSVHPGSYRLRAMTYQGQPETFGSVQLEVGNEDVKDVALQVVPPADLSGQVIIEAKESAAAQQNAAREAASNQPAKTPPAMKVLFYPTGSVFFNAGNENVADDGSFTIPGVVPAKYGLFLQGVPDGGYISSVRVGDQEAKQQEIDLSGGVSGPLKIYVKMTAGQLDGTVHDGNSQAASGAMVTLIPDPPQPWEQQRYSNAHTDQNGAFQIRNVPPGTYRLYAWEDLEPGAQYDPAFVEPHSSKSERVVVDENGHASVTLNLISIADVEAAKGKTAH